MNFKTLFFVIICLIKTSALEGAEPPAEVMGTVVFRINLKLSMWNLKRIYKETFNQLPSVRTRNDLIGLLSGTKSNWYENFFKPIIGKNFSERFSDNEIGLRNIQEFCQTAQAQISHVLQRLDDVDQFMDSTFDDIHKHAYDVVGLKSILERLRQKVLEYNGLMESRKAPTSVIQEIMADLAPILGMTSIFKGLERSIKQLESRTMLVKGSGIPQIKDKPTPSPPQPLPQLDAPPSSGEKTGSSKEPESKEPEHKEHQDDRHTQDDVDYDVPPELLKNFNKPTYVPAAPTMDKAEAKKQEQLRILQEVKAHTASSFTQAKLNSIKWRDFFEFLKLCQNLDGFAANTTNNKVRITYRNQSFTIHNSQFDSEHKGRVILAEFRKFLSDSGLNT